MGDRGVRVVRTLPPTPEAARQARQALSPLADLLERQAFDDLRLLVTEVVTNSLRHAGLGPGDVIDLTVNVEQGFVRVEVRDPGRGFDPQPHPRPQGEADGWGLHLLGRIAHRWGVTAEPATCVWFEIDM